MTDKEYCDITIVADRSGSMMEDADPPHTKAERSTSGVAQLVREQKAQPGRVRFSLVQFDTIYEWIATAAEDLSWTCQPRGGTALLDAVGRAITETGERLAKMPEHERPGKVIFVIATDGEENSSHEYTLDSVKKMVTTQRERYGWDFAFIGVDIDAFAGAGGMGIPMASAMPADADTFAVAYAATSDAITNSRASGQSLSYSPQQRQQVKDAGRRQ